MYRVEVDRAAAQALTRLPPKHRRQVVEKIDSLAGDPRPQDSKALPGYPGGYRVDSGEYRILYVIDDSTSVVTVFLVKHRRGAYR